jgi:hypothetical protein
VAVFPSVLKLSEPTTGFSNRSQHNLKLVLVRVVWSMGSLNVALTLVFGLTPVALSRGDVLTTVGPVASTCNTIASEKGEVLLALSVTVALKLWTVSANPVTFTDQLLEVLPSIVKLPTIKEPDTLSYTLTW